MLPIPVYGGHGGYRRSLQRETIKKAREAEALTIRSKEETVRIEREVEALAK